MPTWGIVALAFTTGLWVGTAVCDLLHRKYKQAIKGLVEAQREEIEFLDDLLNHSHTAGTQ